MVFIFFLITLSAFAGDKFFESVSGSLVTVSSESELKNHDDKKLLTFRPNVATGFGISLETKYIGVGYTFSGKDPQSREFEKSKYRDIRFNFHHGSLDFRLNYQNYRGAVVDDNHRSVFYRDYEVKSINGRVHYYFNRAHLNYIREGRKLVERITFNSGQNFSSSWFLGLNVDQRSITLPENLIAEHSARLSGPYHRNFSALSAGPLGGYDALFQKEIFFVRGKVAGGPAFQTSGGTVGQYEFALATGAGFKKRHLVSLGIDIYVMNFKDESQRISNNNTQVGVNYTYAFNE